LETKGHGNLEWLETGLRAALHKDACTLLGQMLSAPLAAVPGDRLRAGEKRYGQRRKVIETLLGAVEIRRNYYHCPSAQEGRAPLDEALGLIEGYSPALARMMCRAGALSSFQAASADLLAYAGLAVEGREIQRMVNRVAPQMQATLEAQTPPAGLRPIPVLYAEADGTGIPMLKEELAGRAGRQPDGSAKTREAKLGCVFTQQGVDEEGWPLRDPDSTSYVATLQNASAFGGLLRQEGARRGLASAVQVVFLGDGAAWVWEAARINFPGALQILDLWHAQENLAELCTTLYGKDSVRALSQRGLWSERLKEDGIEEILAQARSDLPRSGPRRKAAQKQIAYFENNRSRMLYATFRAGGYFVGSGVVEGGCKTVIGHRLKQSGMFWSSGGAQNVMTTRCAVLSRRFDTYWDRRNARPDAPSAIAA